MLTVKPAYLLCMFYNDFQSLQGAKNSSTKVSGETAAKHMRRKKCPKTDKLIFGREEWLRPVYR